MVLTGACLSSTLLNNTLNANNLSSGSSKISRTDQGFSDAERNYAVIEKEALTSTWACERLEEYVLGLRFTLKKDHKPLVPLFTTTDLSKMLPRTLCLCLGLMRYNPEVMHIPSINAKFQLIHFCTLQLTLRIHLTHSLLKKLKPLLAPQWNNFLSLPSTFKKSKKPRETMKYACKSEGIAKQDGRHTCPINPYSGLIGKAELTVSSH